MPAWPAKRYLSSVESVISWRGKAPTVKKGWKASENFAWYVPENPSKERSRHQMRSVKKKGFLNLPPMKVRSGFGRELQVGEVHDHL